MFRARIRAFCAGVGPGGGPVVDFCDRPDNNIAFSCVTTITTWTAAVQTTPLCLGEMNAWTMTRRVQIWPQLSFLPLLLPFFFFQSTNETVMLEEKLKFEVPSLIILFETSIRMINYAGNILKLSFCPISFDFHPLSPRHRSCLNRSDVHPGVTLVAMSKILSSLAESGPLEEGGGGGGAGFGGVSESPRTMFTRQYSINAMNTNTVQTDMKASTAFRYETGGRDAWLLACCVERVSKEVTPSVTLAGAASGFIQKETHCTQIRRGNY